MHHKNKQLVPSLLETWGVLLGSLLILLVGNAKLLLQRYGLLGSSQLVKSQLDRGISSGLTRLDSFTATNSIVTFAIWGIVGLIAFSFVQALLSSSSRLKFERQLSSNEYVHPVNFNRKSYWRHIVTASAISFGLSVVLVIAVILYVTQLIPVAFTQARHFLLQVSFLHIGNLIIGFLTLFIGTYLLYIVLKLLLLQHRRSST